MHRRPSEHGLGPSTLTPDQQVDAVNDPVSWPNEQQVREQAYKEYKKAHPLSRLPFVGPSRSRFARMNADNPDFARVRLQMRRAAGLLPVEGILAGPAEIDASGEGHGALSRYHDPRTLPVEDSFSYYHDQRTHPMLDSMYHHQEQEAKVSAEGVSRYEEHPRAESSESVPPRNGPSTLARRRDKPGFFKRMWNRVSRKVDIQEAPASGPDDGTTPHRRG